MTTLTDRYVEATLLRLPGRQRHDIERELRASIADAVDDRIEAGDEPAAAENTVLTELGEPARLAARYADRPRHLIGPELYGDYVTVLTALLATVIPIVVTVLVVAHTYAGDSDRHHHRDDDRDLHHHRCADRVLGHAVLRRRRAHRHPLVSADEAVDPGRPAGAPESAGQARRAHRAEP